MRVDEQFSANVALWNAVPFPEAIGDPVQSTRNGKLVEGTGKRARPAKESSGPGVVKNPLASKGWETVSNENLDQYSINVSERGNYSKQRHRLSESSVPQSR